MKLLSAHIYSYKGRAQNICCQKLGFDRGDSSVEELLPSIFKSLGFVSILQNEKHPKPITCLLYQCGLKLRCGMNHREMVINTQVLAL